MFKTFASLPSGHTSCNCECNSTLGQYGFNYRNNIRESTIIFLIYLNTNSWFNPYLTEAFLVSSHCKIWLHSYSVFTLYCSQLLWVRHLFIQTDVLYTSITIIQHNTSCVEWISKWHTRLFRPTLRTLKNLKSSCMPDPTIINACNGTVCRPSAVEVSSGGSV